MTTRLSAGGSDMDAQVKVATLGPDLQRNIGRQLRSLYDEVLNEPVPDRLRELLQQLDRKAPGES